jgi:putative nucleotidyltransferase with HDIG domain
MSIREQVLERIPEIPALPVAATQVLSLAQNPESGISEIMAAIEYDPGLTSDILRLANTAYFAGPRQIGTLREAGVLFGSQRVVELVLASAVFPVTKHPLEGYDLPAGQLIKHSMAVAIASEGLATLLNRPAPSHTFTAALLADIGKIVLGTFLKVDAEPIVKLANDEQLSFEVAERQILGIDHAEVGATLLKTWNLPDNVIDVVRWHHDPNQLEGDRYVVDLVHIANHLSVGCGLGIGVDGLNYRPEPDAIARLGVDHQILEQATCSMVAELIQMQQQLPGNSEGT